MFFCQGFTCNIKKVILEIMKDLNANPELPEHVNMFNIYENSFNLCNTEYKRFKHFQTCGNYIPPRKYVIGQRLKEININNKIILEPTVVFGQIIPLREVFKMIFERPNFFKLMQNYYEETMLDKEVISNFIQGELWRSKIVNNNFNKHVFPIFLYFDDYETGNALGSHSGRNKLGAVYVSLASLPSELKSTLNNIYLFALFYSKDRKEFGNKRVFHELTSELKFLEEVGIDINVDNKVTTIHFKLGLIIGDNLGIHSILGFTESFSANYRCRFCKVHKIESYTQYVENETQLRTIGTYANDLILNDVSRTGIKEPCVWSSQLNDFHLTENFCVDVMHDLFEGVCNYDIQNILKCLIYDLKLFSLETLNIIMKCFNFNYIESSNKPPAISHENLQQKIRMSASEMLCFCRYLGVMIGHLIPRNLNVWQLWIKLREIIEIVTAPRLHFSEYVRLKVVIEEHNHLYIKFFRQLKPKHHHLVHYPRILKMSGPLIHFWSMRSEQKHRESKMTSNVSGNFKNITQTLAIKAQLRLCYQLLSDAKERLNFGNVTCLDETIYLNFFCKF